MRQVMGELEGLHRQGNEGRDQAEINTGIIKGLVTICDQLRRRCDEDDQFKTIQTVVQQTNAQIQEILPVGPVVANLVTKTKSIEELTSKHEIALQYHKETGASTGTRGILESRAIGGLTRMGGDKTPFKLWNGKLINGLC